MHLGRAWPSPMLVVDFLQLCEPVAAARRARRAPGPRPTENGLHVLCVKAAGGTIRALVLRFKSGFGGRSCHSVKPTSLLNKSSYLCARFVM